MKTAPLLQKIKNKETFFLMLKFLVMAAIIAIGIFIRTREYLFSRSLWYDEAALAINICTRSLTNLHLPLSPAQTAPLGFLYATKIITLILGSTNELALRFIPFISGLLGFFFLSKITNYLPSKKLKIIPLFYYAVSFHLIFYATEFKQYSSDMLIALMTAWLGIKIIEKGFTRKIMFLLALTGFLFTACSFTSIFFLIPVILSWLYFFYKNKSSYNLKASLFVGCLWVIFFFFFLMLSYNQSGDVRHSLYGYWADSFMPFPPRTIEELLWLPNELNKMMIEPANVFPAKIGLALFVLGCLNLLIKKKELLFLILGPLVLCLTASALKKYPFQGRLILFYVPFIYILITEGITFLINRKFLLVRLAGYACIWILFLFSLSFTGNYYKRHIVYEETKPLLAYMSQHMQKEDKIYVYCGANHAFRYYAFQNLIPPNECFYGISSRNDFSKYIQDIKQFKDAGRIWFIFSHVHTDEKTNINEKDYILKYLNSIGRKIDAQFQAGTSLYLYDLSQISDS